MNQIIGNYPPLNGGDKNVKIFANVIPRSLIHNVISTKSNVQIGYNQVSNKTPNRN